MPNGNRESLTEAAGNASESDESSKILKTKHPCIVEAHESTRNRFEHTRPRDREDHIAENGSNWITHCDLVHQFIPMPQGMKILEAKEAVHKEWEKLQKLLAWQLSKVKSIREVFLEAQRKDKNPLCFTDGHLSSQECGVGTKCHQKYRDGIKGRKVYFESWMDLCHLENMELEP